MITVVGHGDLTAPTLAMLESELTSRLTACAAADGTLVIRAGQGLPVVAGRAAGAAGLAPVTVLPAKAGLPVPLRQGHRPVEELLKLSQQTRLLEYDPSSRDSCIAADETLIRKCAKILAVWDGSPSTDRDATAHLVAYALGRGVEVEVLWPEGARRIPWGPPGLPGRDRPTGACASRARGISAERPRRSVDNG